MARYLLKAFRKFDPISGDLPNTAKSELNEIAVNARLILGDTPRTRIDSILKQLNQFIRVGEDIRINQSKSNQSTIVTHAQSLRTYFESNTNRDSIKSNESPKYYAVLALALIGVVSLMEHYEFTLRFESNIREIIKEATEALQYGLALAEKRQENLQIASKGGQARHKSSNDLKIVFIRYHEWFKCSKNYKSQNQAVNRFYNRFLSEYETDQNKKIFRNEESCKRALLEGLRDYEHQRMSASLVAEINIPI